MNPFSFLTQMLRISVPYLFAASGGVIAERSGIISLALEGFMLTGAFSATLGAHYSGQPLGRRSLRSARRTGVWTRFTRSRRSAIVLIRLSSELPSIFSRLVLHAFF